MGQRQKRTGGHGTGGWLRWCAPLCALVAAAWGCPPDCACEQTTRSLTCWSLPWGRMPTWVRTLAVSGDHVPTLSSWGFASNQTQPALESLSLSHSSIETIEGNAFVGLSHLRSLDLSHNRLSVLSRHAFQGLSQLRHLCLNASLQESGATHLPEALGAVPNLRTLELSGNGLQNLPLDGVHAPHLETLVLTNNSLRTLGAEDVSWLMDRRGLRVFLAANPFACDCGLRSLHWWLRNASQCADAPRLVCAEPEARQGTPLETLRREDLVCLNPDLEAVSYVLLGIVLALIGVVFLMVLYLNRWGIKKWLNNIREACRDQMEVYHYRYEQDSDPRLASMAV